MKDQAKPSKTLPTERAGVKYPIAVGDDEMIALLEVRGSRAEHVRLRLTEPATAIFQTGGEKPRLATAQPGEYKFPGSNLLDGPEWFGTFKGNGKRLQYGPPDLAVESFAEGKKFMQLAWTTLPGDAAHTDIWLAEEDWRRSVVVMGGLYTEPAKTRTLEQFRPREAEFRKHVREFILREDALIQESPQPLSCKGDGCGTDDIRRDMWRCFIWCQDRTLEPFQAFFDISEPEMTQMLMYQGCEEGEDKDCTQAKLGAVVAWANQVFNDEFAATLPGIRDVLDG